MRSRREDVLNHIRELCDICRRPAIPIITQDLGRINQMCTRDTSTQLDVAPVHDGQRVWPGIQDVAGLGRICRIAGDGVAQGQIVCRTAVRDELIEADEADGAVAGHEALRAVDGVCRLGARVGGELGVGGVPGLFLGIDFGADAQEIGGGVEDPIERVVSLFILYILVGVGEVIRTRGG